MALNKALKLIQNTSRESEVTKSLGQTESDDSGQNKNLNLEVWTV